MAAATMEARRRACHEGLHTNIVKIGIIFIEKFQIERNNCTFKLRKSELNLKHCTVLVLEKMYSSCGVKINILWGERRFAHIRIIFTVTTCML